MVWDIVARSLCTTWLTPTEGETNEAPRSRIAVPTAGPLQLIQRSLFSGLLLRNPNPGDILPQLQATELVISDGLAVLLCSRYRSRARSAHHKRLARSGKFLLDVTPTRVLGPSTGPPKCVVRRIRETHYLQQSLLALAKS
jgi:hypothetical protein